MKNEKRQNLNLVYTLYHIVVSKTTLVCTATYNANIHLECFILQSATKQAINVCKLQLNEKFFLLRMRLVYLLHPKIKEFPDE